MAEGLSINRNYKDRLFRFIFKDPQELLSLYNAINGSDYSNSEDIIVTTIDDFIYMSMKNDVSFLLYGMLNLYEHQSTWAPNMPYRELIYVVDLLKGYVASNNLDIYGSRQLTLPTPQAIVFYNGTDDLPEKSYLQLSDSFTCKREQSSLEFKTLVLNINYGKNKELMDKCTRLHDYSYFVSEVRKSKEMTGDLKTAIAQAIETCIKKGVLSDILTKHKAEVTNMLLSEYDEAAHIANEKRWSYEDGLEDGKKLGFEQGEKRGFEQGEKRGIIGSIKLCKDMGLTGQETKDKISSLIPIEPELLDELMKEYWVE